MDRKIIAQNITNLSDARYFAAWGVAYMSFNTIPGNDFFMEEEDIREIVDWVEGPRILIENNALEFDELADGHILQSIYSSLPLSKEAFFRTSIDELEKSLPDGNYIISLENEEELIRIQNLKLKNQPNLHVYLDISNIKLSNIKQIGNFGLAIQGGEEEQPGVKSFDELDELYDILFP